MHKKILSLFLLWLSLILINIFFIKVIIVPPLTEKLYMASSAIISLSTSLFPIEKKEASLATDSLISIIQSEEFLTKIAKRKYDSQGQNLFLINALNKGNLNDFIKTLQKAVSVDSSALGVITLKVKLPNPHLSASVCNAIVEETDKTISEPQKLIFKEKTKIIEGELAKKENELKVVEERSQKLIQTKGVLSTTDKADLEKVQEEYEQLLNQLYDTRIKAAGDLPSIQVLDWAKPPTQPLSGIERVPIIYKVFHVFLNSLTIFLFWFVFWRKTINSNHVKLG